MDDDAVRLHELYSSLTRAGFTEDQALKLVAEVMTSSRPSPDS